MRGSVCSPKYSDKETYKKIVDYSCMNQMLNSCINLYSDRIAVVDSQEKSFCNLGSDVAGFRCFLSEKGIKQGSYVGIYANNSYNYIKAFLAITTMGAIAVLLPVTYSQQQLAEAVSRCNIALVLDENLLSVESEKRMDGIDVASDSSCMVLFTSGTTGRAKAVLLSHRAVMFGVKNGCYGIFDILNQRYLQVLPFTHVFGLLRSMLLSIYTGSTLFISKSAKNMMRDASVFNPTVIVVVPALAELALKLSKQFKRNMLGSSLKYLYCGGAQVPPYLIKEYEKMGVVMFPGYGLTESANIVAGNPEPSRNPESVGYLYDGVETKIVDDELWIRGPNMTDGYINDPEENAKAFEDGWFKTGDLVRFDDEGFLYITGRRKELIILSNGENVSPCEVENHFNALDCVQDSLVYASKEEDKEVLALQVLPRFDVLEEMKIENVEEYVREQVNKVNLALPTFMQISKIIIRKNEFVRNNSMKIIRGQNGEE